MSDCAVDDAVLPPPAPESSTAAVPDAVAPSSAPSHDAIQKARSKKLGLRKRRRPDSGFGNDDSGDEDESAQTKLALIRDLREEQRSRARPRGLDPEALANGSSLSEQQESAARSARAAAAAAAKAAEAEPAGDGSKKSEFGSGFTAQTGLENPDDPLLKAYIESRMRELRGAAGEADAGGPSGSGTGASGTEAGGVVKDEAWLYEMSGDLRPVDRRSARDADVGEGGFLLGGTGIAEVALPDAFRRANEAETTRAKQAFLERRNLRGAAAVALALGAGAETARALQAAGGRGGGASSAAAAAGASARASIAAAALAAATEGDAEEAAAVGLGAARGPEGLLTLPDGSAPAGDGAGAGAGGLGPDGMLAAPSRFIVGNLSSNFRLHGREYAMKMKGDSGAALHPMMQRSGYGTAAGSALAVTGEGVAGLIHQLKHGHTHSHGAHGGRGGGAGSTHGHGHAAGRGGDGDGRRAGPYRGGDASAPSSAAAAGAGGAAGGAGGSAAQRAGAAGGGDAGSRATHGGAPREGGGAAGPGREGGAAGGSGPRRHHEGGGDRRRTHASDDAMFNSFRRREIASFRNK